MAVQMEDESTIQKNIADKLIAALKTGGFVLYAQKILALADSGEKRPFQEVLVRFKEEEEKVPGGRSTGCFLTWTAGWWAGSRPGSRSSGPSAPGCRRPRSGSTSPRIPCARQNSRSSSPRTSRVPRSPKAP